ncbi:MAG: thrombospondin type 3 repeat-containing protein [Granulosicoccus sp.]|nr:thrombospondin type 3 repeat-containing protein [Granulosicoccus sp.]
MWSRKSALITSALSSGLKATFGTAPGRCVLSATSPGDRRSRLSLFLLIIGLSAAIAEPAFGYGRSSQQSSSYFWAQSKSFSSVNCASSCHNDVQKLTSMRVTANSVAHNANSVVLSLTGSSTLNTSSFYWRYKRVGTSGDGKYMSNDSTDSASIAGDSTPQFRYCIAKKPSNDGGGEIRRWNCGTVDIDRDDPPNSKPNINNIPDQTLNADQNRTITVTASDESPGTVTFAVTGNSDSDVVSVNSLGNGRFRLSAGDPGSSEVTIRATDNGGLTDTEKFTVTVNPPADNAPQINSIADRNMQVGQSQPLTVTVDDEDPDSVDFEVTGNTNSGAVSISADGGNQFTLTANAAGESNITIRATDAGGKTDSDTFKVTVTEAPVENQPPVLTSPGNINLSFGENRKIPIEYTDENPGTVTMSVTENSNPLAVLVVAARTSFQAQALLTGSAQIELTATDEQGLTASQTFTVTVGNANLPPVITSVSPGSNVDVNTGQSIDVKLNVTDENPGSLAYDSSSDNDFTASVSHTGGGTYSITGQSAGSTSVTLSVTDDAGQRADTTVTVNVTTANGVPTANPDQFVFDFLSETQLYDVLANDSDPEGAALVIMLNSNQTALGGSVALAGSQVEYTPPAQFESQDSFSYQVMDPAGQASPSAIVSVLPSDSDGDGIYDGSDNCPILANPGQENADGDDLGDACDPDPDGDGVIGEAGNPFESGKALVERLCLDCHREGLVGAPEFGNEAAWAIRVEQAGGILPLLESVTFGKGEMPAWGREYTARELIQAVYYLTGLEDVAIPPGEVDRDLDGIDDLNDNCINHPNSDQLDSDGDGIGDACEPDENGDGILDYSLSFVIFQETPAGRVTGGIVDAALGPVTILARTRAGIEGLTHDWSATDAAILDKLGDTSSDVVTFTPTVADTGVYDLQVTVQGAGIRGTTRARLVIVASPLSDDLSDTDYDGYPGSLDNNNSNANRLLTDNQNVSGSSVFYSDQSITLGAFTARRAADARYQNARATLSQQDFLSAAGSEYPDVTPVTDPSISNSIGVMDFELRDLDTDKANVRLNLLGNIPLGAGLKIYNPREARWTLFVGNGADSLASAPASVSGDCPASSSPNYTPGLIAGQTCVRFQLTDGGPNDADGQRDGVISMIGAIGTLADDGGPGGPDDVIIRPAKGGGSIGWFVMLLVPAAVWRYRRKYPAA